MEIFNQLLNTNPSVISFSSVALALTMLIGTLGGLAFKATQAPQSSNDKR